MGTEHDRRGIAVLSSSPLCVYCGCNISSVDIINYAVIRNILSLEKSIFDAFDILWLL